MCFQQICKIIKSLRISLHYDRNKASNFSADYFLHLHSSGSPTLEAANNLHQITKLYK